MFGRSWPPPVFDLSVPENTVLGNPLDFEMIVLTCHPPRTAPPTPVCRNGFPLPNGSSSVDLSQYGFRFYADAFERVDPAKEPGVYQSFADGGSLGWRP